MDQSDAELPVPESRPLIPRGKIRVCLFLPPLVSPFFAMLVGPGALPLTLVAILLGFASFVESVGVRYQGRSLALLGAGYIVGEIVACAAVYLPFVWAEGLI